MRASSGALCSSGLQYLVCRNEPGWGLVWGCMQDTGIWFPTVCIPNPPRNFQGINVSSFHCTQAARQSGGSKIFHIFWALPAQHCGCLQVRQLLLHYRTLRCDGGWGRGDVGGAGAHGGSEGRQPQTMDRTSPHRYPTNDSILILALFTSSKAF